MSFRKWVAAAISVIMILLGVWHLEKERDGLSIAELSIGSTPATVYRRLDISSAPAVIIAHGFAGSRQLMEAYALTLAHAGYIAVSFDFEGHGRNPRPMSGDVSAIDGTTQLLMGEIERVTDAVAALPGVDGRIALLGHSMAADIIVRRAIEDPRISATVAISMFSRAVTESDPQNLLIITGEWEPGLRKDGLRNLRLADPEALEGETIGNPGEDTGRRAVIAPSVEHVGVLYSATGLREARDWLGAVFDRRSAGTVSNTGGWIVLLLLGIVILAWPLSGLLPSATAPPPKIETGTFLLAALAPSVITPLVLTLFDTRFLPVLVADYLAVHLFVFGCLSIGLLYWRGVRFGPIAWASAIALTVYGIIVFGGALDRYVASFIPVAQRLPIIAAIAVGSLAYMMADSMIVQGGRASPLRVLIARGAFLSSLGVAVALDFERLFFLVIIIPIILLFFGIFGLMGGWVGRQSNSPAAVGIALGLILAWSLGVSFPMFRYG